MLFKRVMPCLLLKNGALVKTVRFKNPKYIGDPINTVRIYNKKEVDELLFLDIGATQNGTGPAFELIHYLSQECFMPFSYGGGIHSLDDVKRLFSLGVEKISINTAAWNDHSFITKISELYGSQSVIVSIDVKKDFFGKYRVCVKKGRKK